MNAHAHPLHMPTAGFADPVKNVAAFGIVKGMKVADLGAGSGAYALALAKTVGESGRVYAVDVQKDLLRRIRNDAHRMGIDARMEFLWGDIEESGGSKLAQAIVDFVLLSNTLFQLPDKKAALREARRIVKPGGRLAIIEWSDSFGGVGPHPNDVVKKEHALDLAHESGFEIMREFPAGAHHYGLLLRPAITPQKSL